MKTKQTYTKLATKKNLKASLMMVGMARATMNEDELIARVRDMDIINAGQFQAVTHTIKAIDHHIASRNRNTPIMNETHLDILIEHLQNAINDIE